MMKELERRVIQAEKLASLGQLAASVVHEINNPMTAVATYADALIARSSTATDPADLEKYKKIRDNCERVLRFTRNLVSYARPAQDKPVRVDVHPVIDMAVGFCDHVLEACRQQKRLRRGPQHRRVLGNMAGLREPHHNARHATAGGRSSQHPPRPDVVNG
jgi:C4-dicarboxylate-specific signal transduction histidine kinase